MRGAIWLVIIVTVLGGTAVAQTSGQAASEPSVNQPSVKKSGEASQSNPADANADELKALEADTQRMRAILNQMRDNLAFVGSTTTPVNHQFELEIEMWQVVLSQMERRIAHMRERTP